LVGNDGITEEQYLFKIHCSSDKSNQAKTTIHEDEIPPLRMMTKMSQPYIMITVLQKKGVQGELKA